MINIGYVIPQAMRWNEHIVELDSLDGEYTVVHNFGVDALVENGVLIETGEVIGMFSVVHSPDKLSFIISGKIDTPFRFKYRKP